MGDLISDWYRVEFTNDEIARGEMLAVALPIQDALRRAGLPEDGAVFESEWDYSKDPGGTTFLYFSPMAALACACVIAGLRGEPCSKPPSAGLSLMHGHPSTWRLLE
jgi:hypothetical protein